MLVKHERRPFRFGVTLLAGLLGCLSLMGCKDEKTGAQAPTVPAVEVAVEIVTPQKVLYTTELAGRTSGFQIAEVRPQVSGIIQKRFFEEGADVKAGDVLYQIDPATYQANLDSAKANLARAEANVAPARLKMQRFKDLVNISAVSKQEFEDAEAAYKQALADVGVDESTGMVTLRAIFPNPKQELLPGMYVRAILNEGVDDQAILLPQRALLRDAKGNPTTYVVNAENKVEIRPLKVGRTQGNSWVVLDGLKAGDKVIVEGLQKIRPGSPVRIAEPTPVKQGAPASEKR